MRLLVFQHVECEHPGSLRRFLARDGVHWDAVELDRGEAIPDLDGYDALWVMGGPMDVWDIEDNPWLVAEKAAIRQWVAELKKPFLGICLGHQLLADALGGTCGPQTPPEIGILDIELTEDGRNDRLMRGLPATQKCLQWHAVRVAQAPEGAAVLARSALSPIQAMRVNENAWSMQYHVEVEPDTVENWATIPDYLEDLIDALGDNGVAELRASAEQEMPGFLSASESLYTNFMEAVR